MTTPQMPNIPGAAVMTDTLDFVKSLWGSMGVPGISIPGIAAPTLSVDDLDKKINELKAVESWLNLNATMLRSSIQALEVQRGTIAALKSMGQSLAAAVQQAPHNDPFAHLDTPRAERAAAAAAAKPAEPPADAAKPDKPAAGAASAAANQMANPAAWWNMLQEQFTQAVNTAMAADPTAKPADAKKAAAHDSTKPAAKPAARKPAAKRAPKAPKA
ncbi:PhaM family polyhydroxyalkanoate granule multifunctional regulatory protein [Pseudoduganella sp. OTU4001]|uniref:PhaM family polyhydroxyalkanoate granule multifunctional regulatory protein n=1 Tax=Pseudoduganella sp. OTU4001 TaxID=3043854 RepID=UPI00313F35F7